MADRLHPPRIDFGAGFVAQGRAPRVRRIVAVGIASAAAIPDASLSASSFYDANTAPAHGRLNGPAMVVWAPRSATVGQWWQVDMGRAREIGKIATQGRNGQWTMTYKLQYSLDGSSWTDYNNGQALTGNANATGTATADLTPFSARYVRVLPQTWNGYPTGRFELYELI